jgi:5'-phosphate synthase pdxT subunit
VEKLATWQGRVVAVRQGRVTGIAFHPELTGEPTFHRALLADADRSVRAA